MAPDGKIYISTGNSTHYLHCIENPDIIGVGCNLVQRAVKLPTWNFNSFPNHPNYFLGPVIGSVCDTVTKIADFEIKKNAIKASPNPALSNSVLTIQYPTLENSGAKLQLYDVNGKLVLEEILPPWSQVHNLRIPVNSEGMFMVRIFSDKYESSSKIFILSIE
ncbi:MAG: T9SS type A sorting domain-containing protein [Bacteroidetes bacterium]|nr:T9SS type A sorting domain-containing protein [Bacteroidota bacterium]